MYKTNRQRKKFLILAYPDTRRIYLFIKILFIILLLFTVITIAQEIWSTKRQQKLLDKYFGSWDLVFLDVDQNDINYFIKNAFINEYSVQYIKEKLFLTSNQRVVIGSVDDNFLKLGNIALLNGRMPIYENEVAIERKYKSILGVENIGDTVSKKSIVSSLQGYTICGIIDNYSDNWKMVNLDVKYINCFVKHEEFQEINVFVKTRDFQNNDLEVNSISYRNNVKLQKSLLISKLTKIWAIMSFLIIMSLYILNKRLISKERLGNFFLNNQKKSLFNRKLIIILVITNVFLVTGVVNELNKMMNDKYKNLNIYGDKIIDNNDIFINSYGYIYNSTNCDNKSLECLRQIQFVPANLIDFPVNIINLILYITLVNVIICFLEVLEYETEIYRNSSFAYLKYYFYNKKISFIKYVLRSSFLYEIIVYIFLFFIVFMKMYRAKKLFYINVLCVLLALIFRFFILHRFFYRKKAMLFNIQDDVNE